MPQTRRLVTLAVPVLATSLVAGWLLAWAIDVSVPHKFYCRPVVWLLHLAK